MINNSIDNNDNDNNNGNHRVNSPFHDNYINNKIASIKLEFKSYLDQLIRKELQRRQEFTNNDWIIKHL